MGKRAWHSPRCTAPGAGSVAWACSRPGQPGKTHGSCTGPAGPGSRGSCREGMPCSSAPHTFRWLWERSLTRTTPIPLSLATLARRHEPLTNAKHSRLLTTEFLQFLTTTEHTGTIYELTLKLYFTKKKVFKCLQEQMYALSKRNGSLQHSQVFPTKSERTMWEKGRRYGSAECFATTS